MVAEFLAVRHAVRHLKATRNLDPLTLARTCGIEPDEWQRAFLESTARQAILLCSRQSGKSTVAAVRGLHTALTQPGSLTLVLSPTERQSKLLFRTIIQFYRTLGRPVAPDVENRLSLELVNGSEIHALPGADDGAIRGFAGVDLLLVDEASRVSDALYFTLRPMMAVSGGDLVLMSTPWGKRGFFYDAWEHGGDRWERTKVTAHECPRISGAWLETERHAMPDLMFRQEYGCAFVETEDQAFSDDDIDRMLETSAKPLFAGRIFA